MTILRHLLSAALALGLTAQAVDARSFARPPTTAESKVEATQRARLKKVLGARRAKNLAAFKAYVLAMKYPHNTETPITSSASPTSPRVRSSTGS